MKELFRTLGLAVNGIHYPDMITEENKITFLTGPSGCGKSTLFRILNGTLDPEEGSVLYLGQDVRELDPLTHRREVSLVSQSVFLFPGTIRENFRQFYQFRELPEPDTEKIHFFLSLCCLVADPDTDCTTFSGGEKQRVYLAVFLSLRPRVLLLDEPTSALDTTTSRLLLKNLAEYSKKEGISLLMISHDPGLADVYAESRILFGEGCRITGEGGGSHE